MLPAIDDGNLMPLTEIRTLREVRLDFIKEPALRDSAEALRAARPDIKLEYSYLPPKPKRANLTERVGAVEIQRPDDDFVQWSIFQSLAETLDVPTDHDAEARIKRELKKRDLALLKRLGWDSEAGAVGVYTDSEADIRVVAEVVNDMLSAKAKT